MSKQQLKKVLQNTQRILEGPNGSDLFRTQKANKKVHTFTYNSSTIKKVFIHLINQSDLGVSGADLVKALPSWTSELNKLTRAVRRSFNALAQSAPKIGKISTVQILEGKDKGPKIVVRALEFTGFRGPRDNFNLLKNAYKEALDTFYDNVLKDLNKPIVRKSIADRRKNVNVDTSGKAFHLEHDKATSNISEFINDALHESISEVYGEDADYALLAEDLKTLGLDSVFTIEKDAEKGELKVFLGSAILNILESKKEGTLRTKTLKKLEKALKKLDVVNIKGSDSLYEGKRKQSIKKVTDPFRKIPGAVVTTEDTKIKDPKSSASSKNKPGKVTKGSRNKGSIPKKRVRTKSNKGLASFPLSVITKLNQDLPSKIKENMIYPALRNRTGRFAESAQIVGVVQTPKGFPSFQYTYQKYPYQTFEPGYAQGSVDRDPRTLIDKSIRELAIQYAIGRFYTRRV